MATASPAHVLSPQAAPPDAARAVRAGYAAAIQCYRAAMHGAHAGGIEHSHVIPRLRGILERMARDLDHEHVAALVVCDMPLSLNFIQCFNLAAPAPTARGGDALRALMRTVLSYVAHLDFRRACGTSDEGAARMVEILYNTFYLAYPMEARRENLFLFFAGRAALLTLRRDPEAPQARRALREVRLGFAAEEVEGGCAQGAALAREALDALGNLHDMVAAERYDDALAVLDAFSTTHWWLVRGSLDDGPRGWPRHVLLNIVAPLAHHAARRALDGATDDEAVPYDVVDKLLYVCKALADEEHHPYALRVHAALAAASLCEVAPAGAAKYDALELVARALWDRDRCQWYHASATPEATARRLEQMVRRVWLALLAHYAAMDDVRRQMLRAFSKPPSPSLTMLQVLLSHVCEVPAELHDARLEAVTVHVARSGPMARDSRIYGWLCEALESGGLSDAQTMRDAAAEGAADALLRAVEAEEATAATREERQAERRRAKRQAERARARERGARVEEQRAAREAAARRDREAAAAAAATAALEGALRHADEAAAAGDAAAALHGLGRALQKHHARADEAVRARCRARRAALAAEAARAAPAAEEEEEAPAAEEEEEAPAAEEEEEAPAAEEEEEEAPAAAPAAAAEREEAPVAAEEGARKGAAPPPHERDRDESRDDPFECPILLTQMRDPVVAADGHTYERAAIADWLAIRRTSPMTGEPLPHAELVPNVLLRRLIAGA